MGIFGVHRVAFRAFYGNLKISMMIFEAEGAV